MLGFIVGVVFVTPFAQYYVATNGSNSASCGAKDTPCATINQVLTNYKGSYTVTIAVGNYTPTPILIQDNNVIVFQGDGYPTLTPNWFDGDFMNAWAGYEFHDLAIILTGGSSQFSTIYTENDSAAFYNVNVTYSQYPNGTFIELFGGSLMVSNVTVTGAATDGYFILALSDGDFTNITVTGSSFSHLSFGDVGSFLNFNCYGPANVLLNDTSFYAVNANLSFIGYWAMDSNQTVTISNVNFDNIVSHDPNVYVDNQKECITIIQNTTWNAVSSSSAAGALEIAGPDDGTDHNITLNNLKFTGCFGRYSGALLVAYNSLNLSNSIFVNNSGSYGNDVVQVLDDVSSRFGCKISGSTSSSALPKAVIWDVSSDTLTDISSYLPDPTGVEPVHRPAREEDISSSPKFGQWFRKKMN